MRLNEGKIPEQNRKISAEGGSVTERAGLGMPTFGLPMCGESAAAYIRLIHHIVVQQGELV